MRTRSRSNPAVGSTRLRNSDFLYDVPPPLSNRRDAECEDQDDDYRMFCDDEADEDEECHFRLPSQEESSDDDDDEDQ